MSLVDINYKNILFTRSDGIDVNLKVNLLNPSDLNENFLVLSVERISTPIETKLFYWINKKRWTLNEFRFFALNNRLCLKVTDKDDNLLASYGNCGSEFRIFGENFGVNFN